jgi:hypothetical protein
MSRQPQAQPPDLYAEGLRQLAQARNAAWHKETGGYRW